MTDFRGAMRRLGQPLTFGEAVQSLRPLGSRGLAARFGVSVRTAQRWLAGTQAPSAKTRPGREQRARVMRAADWRRVAARALRVARTVSCGRVEVASRSDDTPAGTRLVGTVPVNRELAGELAGVAQLLEDGPADLLDAGAAFGDAMLGAASAALSSSGGNRELYRAYLYVTGYPEGVSVG